MARNTTKHNEKLDIFEKLIIILWTDEKKTINKDICYANIGKEILFYKLKGNYGDLDQIRKKKKIIEILKKNGCLFLWKYTLKVEKKKQVTLQLFFRTLKVLWYFCCTQWAWEGTWTF